MDNNLPETTIVTPSLTQAAPTTSQNRPPFLILGGILLVFILLSVGGYFFVKSRAPAPAPTQTPTPTPTLIEGAKFLLLADPLVASVGGQIKVTVFVKSDKDAANLFIAKLKFPNNLLQAKKIELKEATSSGFIKDWFISNWVENTIDNNTGSASLVGGVPNPGFQTQAQSSGSAMADIIFTAKEAGNATIAFDDTSAIYRNSDNTNILVEKTPITINIAGPTPTQTPTPTASPSATPSLTPTQPASPSATPAGPLEGDINGDGKVDLQDLSALLSSWGKDGTAADLNHDGKVNAFDYSRLAKILKDAKIIQ